LAEIGEHGLVALLFDGLDEIPPARRQRLLRRTAAFSARHPLVPWLLTVRDPAVLSGPADARMIELLSVDAEDIIRFAEVMRKRIPKLDGWEFTRRLEAYPELARLARIPLFLVMLMALHGSPVMPSSRVDLIETYLKTLFSPHEHKAVASAAVEASNLREAAEALAFDRLERQEIGATEREVQDVVARADVDAGSPEAVLTRLLINGVLRRQSSIRLQFPYPIVQEYLAACYIIRKCPETLVQRTEDAIQRPWAQVIQFALELHPAPTSIIRSMLEREDDAFATRLRLIGRCVANGANIGAELRPEITRRLTNLWVRSSSWHIRERVGRLIVDAFSSPLPSEVRAALSLPWLTHWGAGEIVTREKDRTLTMEVLSALLGVDGFTTFRTLQPALDAVGDDVFKKYSEKARQPGIGGDELSNVAHLIVALDSNTLTPGIGLDLALDESLPDTLRLAAFSCGAPPLDDRAWPIIRRALNDEYGSWSAIKCIARTSQPDEAVLGLLRDPTLGMGERARLICSPQALFPKPEARRVFIQRCISEESLPLELRDMMLVFAARYDNREAFQDLVNLLPTLEPEIAEATVSLLGHHPLRDLGLGAAKAVASRVSTAEEAVRLRRTL
jgi:hypothetical protein